MTPRLLYSADVEPISSFRAHYELMMKEKAFDNSFLTLMPGRYPISSKILQRVAQRYTTFYPIYDSYIQIAKGEPIRFEALIAKANHWQGHLTIALQIRQNETLNLRLMCRKREKLLNHESK